MRHGSIASELVGRCTLIVIVARSFDASVFDVFECIVLLRRYDRRITTCTSSGLQFVRDKLLENVAQLLIQVVAIGIVACQDE